LISQSRGLGDVYKRQALGLAGFSGVLSVLMRVIL
jgi:hypothetical protein